MPAGPPGDEEEELESLPFMAVPTFAKVLLALEPIAEMADMQTTTIRDSMTAYSTAVGPSSSFHQALTIFMRDFIAPLR